MAFLKGGDEGDRTPDLHNAIVALSQLSYVPFLVREITVLPLPPSDNRGLIVSARGGPAFGWRSSHQIGTADLMMLVH